MRLLLRSIAQIAVVLGFSAVSAAQSQQPAAAADTQWTIAKPLTGRALPCEGGKIKSFTCQNVELLAYLPPSVIGEAGGTDMWGWIDSTTKREFVLIGGPSGTAFVEVTDPIHPKYLGILPPHGGQKASGSPSMKVYKNHAFVGFEDFDNGMQVFDLTQLRNVQTPPAVFQETAHYDRIANVHTIAADEQTGFVYLNGVTDGGETCGSGLHMVDVRTPTKPTFAGCYSNNAEGKVEVDMPGLPGGKGVTGGDGYVHDTYCSIYRGPDKRYKGREICVNSSGTAVVIVDVTDKQHPKMIGVARYPDVGYAHQGWFTEDQKYFFLDDEFDETSDLLRIRMGGAQNVRTRTLVFDMAELDDPILLTEYFATTSEVDHNLYIRGRYMYQSNNGAGLRIIDVVDPKNPKEVGYLSEAGRAWGSYPFFKNDVVAVSTTQGLFLARLQKR